MLHINTLTEIDDVLWDQGYVKQFYKIYFKPYEFHAIWNNLVADITETIWTVSVMD